MASQLERWRATLAGGAARVGAAARVLAAVGEQLKPGDRLITGSVVQVPVRPGDRVAADLGPLGRVELAIATDARARSGSSQ